MDEKLAEAVFQKICPESYSFDNIRTITVDPTLISDKARLCTCFFYKDKAADYSVSVYVGDTEIHVSRDDAPMHVSSCEITFSKSFKLSDPRSLEKTKEAIEEAFSDEYKRT